jgi:flagellar hook-length control protein FliK
MSALTFLATPNATATPPSSGTLASYKPASPLASQPADNNHKTPLAADQLDPNANNSEPLPLSFWDTLQEQAASSDPSLGQQISALMSQQDQQSEPEPDLDLENTLNLVDQSDIQTVNQQSISTEIPVLSPWSMAAMQRSINQTGEGQETTNNFAMDQIESQRFAKLQVQTDHAGVLSPYALRLDGQTTAPLMTETVLPLTEDEASKAINPALGALALANGKDGPVANGLTDKSESGGDFKLDESLLSKETINIHEKPITLAPQESIAAAANTQTTPLTDATLPNMAESLDSIEGLTQQAAKDVQSATSKMESSVTSTADKVLAGQAKIDVPPSSPKFTEQIAQRIGIMNTDKLQTARIQLDPPELGSLEIKIKVQQDQVSVSFSSGHQVVRDALEAQSPRLREMLEQQGVELTDVNVSDQQQQNAGEGQSGETNGDASGDWAEDEMMEEAVINTVRSDSLVDDFA